MSTPLQSRPRVMLKTRAREDSGAVRLSVAMRVPDGPTHHPGPVVALTPSRAVNREAFRGLILRATAYAAVPSFGALHGRLRSVRGSAVGLPCFRCGRRSTGWACTAADADRVTGWNSERRRVTYSLDLADYAAACDGCRAATDAEHTAERRAVAALALSPIRKPERAARTRPEPVPEPEPLFALDPSDPTRWSLA
jgi:hypothetical protein